MKRFIKVGKNVNCVDFFKMIATGRRFNAVLNSYYRFVNFAVRISSWCVEKKVILSFLTDGWFCSSHVWNIFGLLQKDLFSPLGLESVLWVTVSSANSLQLSVLFSPHFAEMITFFYIVIEVVIAVLSVFGNVLVCWAVAINTTLKNATNYFLVSLAVADILVGCLAIPFAITISIGIPLDFYGCLFLACFVLVLTQSSIFSLLAIAIDRYLAVKIPLRWVFILSVRLIKKERKLVFTAGIPAWTNECEDTETSDQNNDSLRLYLLLSSSDSIS